MGSFADDLANWMSNLPHQIRSDVPIINLAIPGSHDSATYGISRNSKLAPDAEEAVRIIYPFVPCIIRKWSRTQKHSLQGQLEHGVRFFDLRVAWNERDQRIYYVHGLYCEEITQSLGDIMSFLQEHPGEFVMIDFQHFYNFHIEHHQLLVNHLMKSFDSIIFHNSNTMALSHLTLDRAFEMGKQLIVVYRNFHTSPLFFGSHHFPTPWPNTTKVEYLKEFLGQQLKCRNQQQGWVLQCVLTPDANYIISRFYSSLKRACAKKVLRDMGEWIESQKPGRWSTWTQEDTPRVNIILGDYMEMNDNEFTKIVIDLNKKLLD